MSPGSHPDRGPSGSQRSGAVGRLGIFGGSFDPVHVGHLHAAGSARDAFRLDRVVFVPARQSPFKPGRELAPGTDRMEMLRLSIRDEPGFEVHDLELQRSGPSYTIDTVRALPSALGLAPDVAIHLILGSDVLEGIAGWRESRALLERVQPIVVHRGRASPGADAGIGEPLAEIRAALGDEIAEKVSAGYLRLPPVPASSSDLRARLPGLRAEVPDIPAAVLDYIRSRRLYGFRG